MFQETSDALVKWANGVLGDGVARLGPPPAAPTGRGVTFHLLDVTPQKAPGGQQYRRLHAALRYLAVAWAEDTATVHGLLGRLTFAAMQHTLVELEPRPPAADVWQALGLPMQPGLLIRCHAYHELPVGEARAISRTIFASTPSSHLSGRVVDVDGRGMEDATIVVPRHQMRARTDDGGRFRLPALPSQEPATLIVHAKGRQQQFELVQSGGRAAGVVIQLGY